MIVFIYMIYYYYYFLYRNKHIQKERDFNTNVHHKLYQKVMVTLKESMISYIFYRLKKI